ncbi:hypothetical protein GGI16_001948 [Coemansia sp. S142-1]|nr:hypothetical protein GGI16_001948 [Coemansia sp. S142-1]
MLRLTKWTPVDRFVAVAPPIHGFTCLKVLEVRFISMAFLDVLRLLKVLPNLVKIGCGIDRLGPELQDIATEDLPDHVASMYGKAGKNLQVIALVWVREMTYSVAPEYAMLMALVCPKLRRIELALKNISDF